MKKVFSIFMVAFVTMMVASCGSSGEGSKSEANSQTTENIGSDKVGIDNASKDNYAALLKEYFGIDTKDFEEDGFTITAVEGNDYYTSKELKLTYKTKIEDTFKAQDEYKAKFFNVTKAIGGGVNYGADIADDGVSGKINESTYTDFYDYKSHAEDSNMWFYKFNGKDVRVYITAGSQVWIKLTAK